MSKAVENLLEAQKLAMANRPEVGGFPYLAETLRAAGVSLNIWTLPSCQAIYFTKYGTVVQQMNSLIEETSDVAKFNREALIQTLRLNQAGKNTFPEFLVESWRAGVIGYEVDFEKRTCTYFGCQGESYIEEYHSVKI